VAEAIFLLGSERNAGKIFGAAFAPILANVNAENWKNNLIYYNADWSEDVRSTSWHVLDLIANVRMTETHPVTSTAPTGPLYWVAGENTDSGSYIFKGKPIPSI
jgi:alpha-N-arabinofuranosidase